MNAYILVAKRRWDVRLDNGVTIKLPEQGASEALAELVALDREQSLLMRGVAVVDMRLSDRIGVELDEQEADLYRATVRERLGISNKAGRRT